MPTEPIACSLSATELPARQADMADLGRAALILARRRSSPPSRSAARSKGVSFVALGAMALTT